MYAPTFNALTVFSGADEDPLSEGGAWPGVVQSTVTRMRRVSGQAAANNAAAPSDAYHSMGLAADHGAAAQIPVLPGAGSGIGVCCRVHNPGNASTAEKIIGVYHPGTGFRIFDMLTGGGSFPQVGSTNATTMAAGESLWLEVIGSTATLWHLTGGVWLPRVTGTTSISGAGFAGIQCDDNVGRLGSFAAGPVVQGASSWATFPKPNLRRA